MGFRFTCSLVLLLIAAPSHAGSGAGSLAQGTFVADGYPSDNEGACTFIAVGQDWCTNTLLRGLVELTMPSPTPGISGRATVTSVTLQLPLVALPDGSGVGTAATYYLERVTSAWGKGGGCGAQATCTYYEGAACTAGGATWNSPSCSAAGWSLGAVSAQASSIGVAVSSNVSWSQSGSGGMLSDVQGWIDTPSTNHGWLIQSSSEGSGTAQAFSQTASLSFTFSCSASYRDTGATCTTCTATAESNCVVAAGNACTDPGPPATSYGCACVSPYVLGATSSGLPACVIGCAPTNHCLDDGDATAVCVPESTGYACTCDTGFVFNGTTCATACPASPDPCGNGGSCAVTGPGTWSCSCPTGYASNGASDPACVVPDAGASGGSDGGATDGGVLDGGGDDGGSAPGDGGRPAPGAQTDGGVSSAPPRGCGCGESGATPFVAILSLAIVARLWRRPAARRA